MLKRAFTTGSCWGWQGSMPHRASVRALDVTLEGDGPELITVILEPLRNSEDLSKPATPLDPGTAFNDFNFLFSKNIGKGKL